jgi:hypothetical protein
VFSSFSEDIISWRHGITAESAQMYLEKYGYPGQDPREVMSRLRCGDMECYRLVDVCVVFFDQGIGTFVLVH